MTPRMVSHHVVTLLSVRQVYTWFFVVYRCSVVIGMIGYVTFVLELFGFARFFDAIGLATTPSVLLWYGLYFGILGRDCAEVASDWMVSSHSFLV